MSNMDELIVEMDVPSSVLSIAQPRISTWTCRLPSEMMARICEILEKDINQHTLSNLQETSSAMYTLATPHLYQHLHLDQFTAISFFSLFQVFPLSDNTRFLRPIPQDIHLMDMHPADRLRALLSNTSTLSLTLRDESVDHIPPGYIQGLERYKDLVIGLSTFAPTLWPSLHQRVIDAGTNSGDSTRQFHYPSMRPDFYRIFIKAIFAKLHPAEILIKLPEFRPQWREDHPSPWDTIMKRMDAKHVGFTDYIPGAEPGISRASSSLTLRIHPRAIARDTKSVRRRIGDIFSDNESMVAIQSLKLVGLIPPPTAKNTSQNNVKTVSSFPLAAKVHVFDSIAKDIKETMTWRLQHGNTADLRTGLFTDMSPEGDAAAVWYTYKQPEDHTQCSQFHPPYIRADAF